MALSQKQIVNICRQELSRAQGWDSDELASNREQALNYFYNRPRGDEQAGRSSIQSTDVSDMVEAIMSNIAPILSNETLIQFEAAGEDDETQAQIESDFVSYMIGARNDGYVEILSAVKDALLLRNGYLKIYVDENNKKETFTLSDLSEFQIQAKLDESDSDHTITIVNLEEEEKGFYKVTFKDETHKKTLLVESVAPENLLYSPEHETPNLDNLRFIAERKLLTQTELLNMGYNKEQVIDLPSYDVDTKNDSYARRQDEQTSLDAADPSQRTIETWDIHIRLDEKQNGIGELRRIHLAEHEILLDEPAEWIPYATGSPFLVPHRLTGQSIFDKLKQIQDSKTHFLRQWHDNAKAVNNSRIVFNPLTTKTEDVMTSRPGAGIRSKDPTGVNQLQTSDMGASILSALDYMDKQRSERGGASLDLAGAQMQLAGQVGDQGAERQISVKEQLAAMMTSTLANTLIRNAYLLTHKTLRAFMSGELTAKIHGKWASSDPTTWPERKHVNVMTGLSNGEKSQRIAMLSQVIQQQVSFITQGQEGEIVDKSSVYNAIMDWARAANLDNPEQYWIDPASPEAQQAQQQKQQQAQQQQQDQLKAQQQQIQLQQTIFDLQAQLEKYKHDTDLTYKYDADRLKAETEEAKIIGSATLELERAQLTFEAQGEAHTQGAANAN